MNLKNIFKKDFTLVVIGQIISLFGNAILRYALPLYLLNKTNSPSLFGIVSALSFIPMIILSPIGGIIADRINKRNIMVILDFSTCAIVITCTLLLGKVDLVILLLVVLILLFGIQGAYQPAVQASIPALVSEEDLMSGNALINLVNSLSGSLGYALGGILFVSLGIKPLLCLSAVCFFLSAVMEIFIKIPFVKQKNTSNIFSIAFNDMKDSFNFITKEKKIVLKICALVACINLFMSTLLAIGLPIIITKSIGFDTATGNSFYGYAQGIMTAGGLFGGILAGTIGQKVPVYKSYRLLIAGSAGLIPIGVVLYMGLSRYVPFIIIAASCFVLMAICAVFSVLMLSYVQIITPMNLIGKVMALVSCICVCVQPIGQAMYGVLFDVLSSQRYILFLIPAAICIIIALISKKSFSELKPIDEQNCAAV